MIDELLISRFQVRVLGGSQDRSCDAMIPTLVTWTLAPEWLTPDEAAGLMGPRYTPDHIVDLIDIGAIVAEQDAGGAWLVEKQGLGEFRDALWEVMTYER